MLLPQMTAAIAREVARISETASNILGQILQNHAELQALLDQVPDLALRREIMQLVGSHPSATVTELAGDVARFAREYRQLLDELSTLRSEDNQLRGAEQAAEEALLQGDLFRARRYLAEAASIARQRASASIADFARLLDREAKLALLDRDWSTAERVWDEASRNLDAIDEAGGAQTAANAAIALEQFGDRFGELGALNSARKIWEALLKRCDGVESVSLAHYLVGYGSACQRQAQRMQGVEGLVLLERSIDAYRQAAQIYKDFRRTAEWAIAQSNVGAASYSRGDNTGGADWREYLDQAREAYETVLEVWTREDRPEKWADLQCSLGLVARAVGARVTGEEQLSLLRRAVEHHRSAVSSNAPPDSKAEDCSRRESLATALYTLADASSPPAGLQIAREAVALIRATLGIADRKEYPASWASLTFALGCALWIEVKHCEFDPDALEKLVEAEDAYWSAAVIWSAENYPRYYAIIEDNVRRLRERMARMAEARSMASGS